EIGHSLPQPRTVMPDQVQRQQQQKGNVQTSHSLNLIPSKFFSTPRLVAYFRPAPCKDLRKPLAPTDHQVPKELLLAEHDLSQPHQLEQRQQQRDEHLALDVTRCEVLQPNRLNSAPGLA